MKTILYDADCLREAAEASGDTAIYADGKYAACRGCFRCWTQTPAACRIRDRLETVCRTIGQTDTLTVVTRNFYGMYSPAVKTVLDRAIGLSTPLSTYRGGQMHHCLRYGPHSLLRVLVYGDCSDAEKKTFEALAERNAVNYGFARAEIRFFCTPAETEAML